MRQIIYNKHDNKYFLMNGFHATDFEDSMEHK